MIKTITYNKIQRFILEHIKTRIEYTDPQRYDPFTTDYARIVENQYVRFVYAGLMKFIKPCKRVTTNKCMNFLYWLEISVNAFINSHTCDTYDFKRIADKHPTSESRTILDNLRMFQEWFVMEFKGEVGID